MRQYFLPNASVGLYEKRYEKRHYRDVSAVLDVIDNLDVGVEECYLEADGECDDLDWADFVVWRAFLQKLVRMFDLIDMFVLSVRLKMYSIRFRKRVHSPGGALHRSTMKRLKK